MFDTMVTTRLTQLQPAFNHSLSIIWKASRMRDREQKELANGFSNTITIGLGGRMEEYYGYEGEPVVENRC